MTDFLARLDELPEDDDVRRVYADALEEQGAAAKSEYLRLELQWSALAHEQKKGWSTVLVRESVNRINTIKAIRELTSLGLKEAKDISDAAWNGVPTVVTPNRTRAQAEAEATWLRRVTGVVVEVRLEGRSPLPSEELWERLLKLSSALEPEWLRAVGRLWELVLLRRAGEGARARIDQVLGPASFLVRGLGRTSSALPSGQAVKRHGLQRPVVTRLVDELNATEPGLAEMRRSACFFDWPVGLT